MSDLCDVGVFGLATMGANLARNAVRNGFRVAVYNRHSARVDALMERYGHEGHFLPASSKEDFVSSLRTPRAIVLMLEAGSAIDAVIEQLRPLLDPGDIIVDAGNSLFSDTDRRVGQAAARGLRFMGMGVSGGEKGALYGPSLMPGGDRVAYDHLAPILEAMAAKVGGEPCCAYLGSGGAGHYVKMVHNGIEYADMQAIAEVYDLLRTSYRLAARDIADVFDGWRNGELSSFLLDTSVDVLRRRDDASDADLVDLVVDEAAQKGTGRWTAADALRLGVVDGTTGAAVDARVLSAMRDVRRRAASSRTVAPVPPRSLDGGAIDDLHATLLAARVISFSQGFDLLAAASCEQGWRLDLGAVAALWRGGCIIRARLLDHIVDAQRIGDDPGPLVLQPWFADTLAQTDAGWRRVVSLAISEAVPLPVSTAALAYYDGLHRERSPGNLIQALRDEFGAHGYRRFGSDDPQHTDWRGTGTDAQ